MPFRLLSALSGLLFAFASFAQGAPVEGTDYVELKPPQAVETSGNVEVIEFFWYRCPHCYALEPDLEAWVTTRRPSRRRSSTFRFSVSLAIQSKH